MTEIFILMAEAKKEFISTFKYKRIKYTTQLLSFFAINIFHRPARVLVLPLSKNGGGGGKTVQIENLGDYAKMLDQHIKNGARNGEFLRLIFVISTIVVYWQNDSFRGSRARVRRNPSFFRMYSFPFRRDEGFRLSTYPCRRSMVGYTVAGRVAGR